MISKANVKKYLEKSGAVLKGHFKLSSGLHSQVYIQCALALKNPKMAQKLGRELKNIWKGLKPDFILSPAIGAIIIGHETAKAFNKDFLFMERVKGKLKLRRSFKFKKGAKILIVEDVFTTGKSTMEIFSFAKNKGAEILGALSIVNRMGKKKFCFPFESLVKISAKTHKPSNCPFCEKHIPLEKPGSREL